LEAEKAQRQQAEALLTQNQQQMAMQQQMMLWMTRKLTAHDAHLSVSSCFVHRSMPVLKKQLMPFTQIFQNLLSMVTAKMNYVEINQCLTYASFILKLNLQYHAFSIVIDT
jgi:hypothetical protein